MTKCLRIIGLCVSLSVFLGLLGFVTTRAVAQGGGGACECDFNSIPKTTACWSQPPFTSLPNFTSNVAIPPEINQFCTTKNEGPAPVIASIRVGTSPGGPTGTFVCQVRLVDLPDCGPDQEQAAQPDNPEQFETCLCDLQTYTNDLVAAGISVSGGPPYECSDPPLECAPPIPTLNQYGMIIMAGVLGLFAMIGLLVMRRSGVAKPSN